MKFKKLGTLWHWQVALKLLWRPMVEQHLTEILHVGFSCYLSPICLYSIWMHALMSGLSAWSKSQRLQGIFMVCEQTVKCFSEKREWSVNATHLLEKCLFLLRLFSLTFSCLWNLLPELFLDLFVQLIARRLFNILAAFVKCTKADADCVVLATQQGITVMTSAFSDVTWKYSIQLSHTKPVKDRIVELISPAFVITPGWFVKHVKRVICAIQNMLLRIRFTTQLECLTKLRKTLQFYSVNTNLLSIC